MRFLDEYINSLMLWSEFTAQFWPILSFDQKYCLTYVVGVVTMADLLQNQQNKNLWAVPIDVAVPVFNTWCQYVFTLFVSEKEF